MKNTALSRSGCPRAGLVVFLAGFLAANSLAGAPNPRVMFNRDIRPLLSDNCLACHGFDSVKRKADLRLDSFVGATALHKDWRAIAPGNLAKSEMWRRINSTDPKLMMPPPDSGKKLKPADIALLGHWIEQGAVYQKHWAFVAPVRPEPPAVRQADWPRNDLDRFILAKLEAQGLKPSPEASKETLIRRVTLDLTGLPPTLAEVDAFLADQRTDAYERLVDRLLSSPHYGEEMARHWLDLARYGDTHGLHLDNERSLWPYRDWVVSAFNTNLSFDQFTIWQLAGDLLPKPTREQLVASGFNRCNLSTSEGGAIDEEFQVRYAIDRVETTSTTWLGLTMGCAVCHDHKLDPIKQKEFYEVFSIFNNIAEKAMDGNALLPPPSLPLPSPEQEKQLADFDSEKHELESHLDELVAKLDYADPASVTNATAPEPKELVWLDDDFPPDAEVKAQGQAGQWVTSAEGPVFSGKRSFRRSGEGLHQTFFATCSRPLTIGSADKLFAYVYLDPKDPPKAIMLQYHTDEWHNRANWGDPDAISFGQGTAEKVQLGELPEKGKWVRLEFEAGKIGLHSGMKVTGLALTQFGGTAWWDKAGIITVNDPAKDTSLSLLAWEKAERALGDDSKAPKEIKKLLKKKESTLSAEQCHKLRNYFLAMVYSGPDPSLSSLRKDLKGVAEKRAALEKEIPATMISKELDKPRPAWVLIRGQYDKHGEPVGPGTPAILPPLPKSDATNRLTFARWLVEPENPLTARVTVNRFWQQFFGVGIVKTAEDFGTRGEWPSHPELLDWLATEFIQSGWDVKHMVRLMVTSATYRQDSHITPQLRDLDPENRLLARGPRYRLDAEELRDYALDVSGLLNFKMGGRGVHPYQPAGIWKAVGYTTSNTAHYVQDHGEALYRRSIYVFWKRTAPPPYFTTFDAPSREKCWARRERTNTPLQALVTMNDPQYFEAARHLGYRLLHEGGATDAERLRYGFRMVTDRAPTQEECAILEETLAAQRAHFDQDAAAAKKAISVGESPVPTDVPAPELAAYTMMANLLLNLDETVTLN